MLCCSSVGGRGVPGMWSGLQAGRRGSSPCPGGASRVQLCPGRRPASASFVSGCLPYNTALSFCPPKTRSNLLLCLCKTETNVTSSNTHISSHRPIQTVHTPSTAALLSRHLCPSLVLSPAETCHPSPLC